MLATFDIKPITTWKLLPSGNKNVSSKNLYKFDILKKLLIVYKLSIITEVILKFYKRWRECIGSWIKGMCIEWRSPTYKTLFCYYEFGLFLKYFLIFQLQNVKVRRLK